MTTKYFIIFHGQLIKKLWIETALEEGKKIPEPHLFTRGG